MSLLQLAYVVALRRIISNWKLELFLFLGIVLAVALMSSGVVFSDHLAEASLRRSLNDAAPDEANFHVWVFNPLDNSSFVPRERSVYQESLDFIEDHVYDRFERHLRDQAYIFETSTFYFQGNSKLELAEDVRPRGRIKYVSGFTPERIELVEGGRLPYSTGIVDFSLSRPLEVVIDERGLETLDLEVGEEMELVVPFGEPDQPNTTVKIVGLIKQVDPADEFWYGIDSLYDATRSQWVTVHMFTTEEAIFQRVGSVYPRMHSEVTWFFYLDREAVRAGDVDALQKTIADVEYDVPARLNHSGTRIRLDNVLDEYERQLLLARVPLFLMVFLIIGVLCYYLTLVAGLIVRSRATEIAMLKSRGSTTFQIGILALVEGLILAVPAIAIGPLLALGVSKALGTVFFHVGGTGASVPLSLSSEAFLVGAGGAALAVFVLSVSAWAASRRGIVEYRHTEARPQRAPFIHRCYLDFLALAVIGLVWWLIQSRGSFLVRPLSGDLEIDYSLLIGPVLGLMAVGLLVLRVFPLVVVLVSKLVEPVGPAWLVQGLKRVSRDPLIPGTLVVMFMLATSLGVVGSAFSSTLERSQRDRALYAAGSELRVEHNGDSTPRTMLDLSEVAAELDGVESAVEVGRMDGSLLISFDLESVTILSVDAERIADVAWYREDFAGGQSLEELAEHLVPDLSSLSPENDGLRLPEDARSLAVWVRPGRPDPRLFLRARLRDSRGYYFEVPIGAGLGSRDWRRLEGDLVPAPRRGQTFEVIRESPTIVPPLTFLSLRVSRRAGTLGEPNALFFDRLTAKTPDGEHVVSDFESLERWHTIEDYSRPDLYALELSESVVREGSTRSAAFTWAPGGIGVLGIRYGPPVVPLPAVVSDSLLKKADVGLGDTVNISTFSVSVPIKPLAVADYFPTLYPRDESFVLVDLATMSHFLNLHRDRVTGNSDELWVRLRDRGLGGAERDAADRAAAANVSRALRDRGLKVHEEHLASDMVMQRTQRPLVSDGWSGVLVLLFLALVLASASGLVLFTYIDTRERETEYALLRTLGFTREQLKGLVWFNLLLVVAIGIGLGAWSGQLLGEGVLGVGGVLPVLEIGEEGARITPPMVFETNRVTLLTSYLVLAAIAVGTAVWLGWLTGRLEVQRVLRIGEA